MRAPAGQMAGVLQRATRLHPRAAVEAAFDRMAAALTACVGDRDPLVIAVMMGGLYPTARLVERFAFPYRMDYLHATRYRGGTAGGDLQWRVELHGNVRDQNVLVVDDIFDEGVTLAGILTMLRERGARQVSSAALVRKLHDRRVGDCEPDVIGLDVPDRYVFGCGMDYRGYFRGLPEIYALGDEH